jgi:hypothetical protein
MMRPFLAVAVVFLVVIPSAVRNDNQKGNSKRSG